MNDLNLFIEQMPKIDIHCHLDGSLDLETTRKLLSERGEEYDLPTLTDRMQVSDDCKDLTEYLERFDLPNHCLQDAAGIEESSYALARNTANENVKYLEVRFAPALSATKGMSFRDIIEAVEKGLSRARSEFDIKTGIILCAMRGFDEEQNREVFHIGREMLGSGVVAVDIAGAEALYPMALYKDLFEYAKKLELPYTIHAGETGNVDNIKGAVELGTRRLGHGIAMASDPETIKLCASKGIGAELCPTSNIHTKAYPGYGDCPIMKFMEYGVPVSLNTDNRTVSHTNSTLEFKGITEALNLEAEDLHKIYQFSVDMIFADDAVKHDLLSKWKGN
jgi:adenosine deaminase